MRAGLRRVLPEAAALGLAGAALVGVHIAQAAGLVPCALCYLERWPYRLVVIAGAVGLGIARARPAIRPLLLALFAVAAAMALVHVGVEAGWWASPLPECAAPPLRTGSMRDLLASLPAHAAKPCDDPTYLVPWIKVSLAQMNGAYALASIAVVTMCRRWTL